MESVDGSPPPPARRETLFDGMSTRRREKSIPKSDLYKSTIWITKNSISAGLDKINPKAPQNFLIGIL
jgi:hypothetical protein